VVRTVRFPLDYRHGDGRLADARAVPSGDVAAAAGMERRDALRAEGLLYLDTETTSLSGGAGVLVFLVGVGRFEADAFVVRQLFMRDPSEEPAMLDELEGLLREADGVVSFCGRTFDAPRVRDRFLFQDRPEQEGALRELPHLDLHPPSRRLFGHRLPDNRLRTLEESELGFTRSDDLPGSECPEAYFAYQRGVSNRIPEIMEHNLHDVLSLVMLEARLASCYVTPDDAGACLAAGVIAFEGGDLNRARVHLVRAARDLPPLRDHLPPALILRAVRGLRRLGESAAACLLLQRTAACWPRDHRVLESLAVLHERDLGDLEAALCVAERALLVTVESLRRAGWLRRHRRLRRRLERGVREADGQRGRRMARSLS